MLYMNTRRRGTLHITLDASPPLFRGLQSIVNSVVISVPLNERTTRRLRRESRYTEQEQHDRVETPSTSTECDMELPSYSIAKRCHTGDCPICLEKIKVRQHILHLPCSHVYHRKCLETWFQRSRKCPTCRKKCAPEMRSLPAAHDAESHPLTIHSEV